MLKRDSNKKLTLKKLTKKLTSCKENFFLRAIIFANFSENYALNFYYNHIQINIL